MLCVCDSEEASAACCLKVVYYESIKRELKTRPMYECRCDERLKIEVEESTRHWVARGTGTPKDNDEVNRRDV